MSRLKFGYQYQSNKSTTTNWFDHIQNEMHYENVTTHKINADPVVNDYI